MCTVVFILRNVGYPAWSVGDGAAGEPAGEREPGAGGADPPGGAGEPQPHPRAGPSPPGHRGQGSLSRQQLSPDDAGKTLQVVPQFRQDYLHGWFFQPTNSRGAARDIGGWWLRCIWYRSDGGD